MEYKDITKHLKRYSFDEKMRVCFEMSAHRIESNGTINCREDLEYPLPWEVETFLLLSIYSSPEYDSRSFTGRGRKRLSEMMACIRDFLPAQIFGALNTPNLITKFLCSSGLTQFDIQEAAYIKVYRYSYFFEFCNEKVNMPELFFDKFNTYYKDFRLFTILWLTLLSQHKPIPKDLIRQLCETHFPEVFNSLTISLLEYKDRLRMISDDPTDFSLCLRPSYTIPFIETEGKVYFPLPHLLIRATTSSLLYRLTEDDNQIRKLIGKEVLENYLYSILCDSNCFEECYPDKEYTRERHQKARTADVMARHGKDVIFFDSKSAVPKSSLRLLDDDAIDKDVENRAESIVQIYKNLRENLFIYPSYSPFENKIENDPEKLWGIVVVLENSYVQRELYYKKAASMLGIETCTDEYTWMKTHIKVYDLYMVERYALAKKSIIEALKCQIEMGSAYDFSLPDEYDFQIVSNDYDRLWDKIKDDIQAITYKLQEKKM